MQPDTPGALSRRELAARLGVSRDSVRRNESFLDLDRARIATSRTGVRYSRAVVSRLSWWRRLEGEP